MTAARYGSVEAGGTKFVLATGDGEGQILSRQSIPTTTPDETLSATIDFFRAHPVEALGIGSFGPIDIRPESATYGAITTTPKPGWAGTSVLSRLRQALDIPMSFTTDVNASAYGEMTATGCDSLVYVTIGTGIGGGAVQAGHFVGGVSHQELGHQSVARATEDAGFAGVCPYHGDCLEGLASGPALAARVGRPAERLDASDPVWAVEAYYLAQLAVNATLAFAPERIVLGGGVMAAPGLMARVRTAFVQQLAGYVALPASVEAYLTLPAVADNGSATLGNLTLAKNLIK